MSKLERDTEDDLRLYAKTLGYVCYKFVSPGNRGVPDRIFINRNGVTIFVEMKRQGETPDKSQERQIKKIKGQLAPCFVVDNYEFGCQVLDAWRDKIDTRM